MAARLGCLVSSAGSGRTTLSDSRTVRCQTHASKPRPPTARVSPDYPHHPSTVPCPLPRWIGTGASVDCFPVHPAFPVVPAGRHPYLHFRGLVRLYSRYGPLDRSPPRRPSSRGSDPASHPARPLVSYQINRQLSGWNLSSTGDTRLRKAQNKSRTFAWQKLASVVDWFSASEKGRMIGLHMSLRNKMDRPLPKRQAGKVALTTAPTKLRRFTFFAWTARNPLKSPESDE